MADNTSLASGGVKYDLEKLAFDLLPPDVMVEVVYVFTLGADKYEPRNWEKGMRWGRILAALKRHLTQWEAGEPYDSETGARHLAQVITNAMFLLAYELRGVGEDDLPRVQLRRDMYGAEVPTQTIPPVKEKLLVKTNSSQVSGVRKRKRVPRRQSDVLEGLLDDLRKTASDPRSNT